MPILTSVAELELRVTDLAPLPPFRGVALADPAEFDVAYAINPHMLGPDGELQQVDRTVAREQWEALRGTLAGLGLEVTVEPALPGHLDFVFCANPGLPVPAEVAGGPPRWVSSRMAAAERAGEVAVWERVFAARGWRIEPLEGEAERFEGTGDGLWHPRRRLLWGGVGPRTDRRAWEELAERYDLPPLRILGNKTMIDVAQRRPRGEKELLRIEGVTPQVLGRIGDRIRRALERAERRGPVERLPSAPRRDGAQLDELESELHDRLKRMRKEASEKDGIESAYLLNRHVLLALAKERPTSSAALESLELLEDWQLDRFGDSILDTVVAFERDVARGAIKPRGGQRRRRR